MLPFENRSGSPQIFQFTTTASADKDFVYVDVVQSTQIFCLIGCSRKDNQWLGGRYIESRITGDCFFSKQGTAGTVLLCEMTEVIPLVCRKAGFIFKDNQRMIIDFIAVLFMYCQSNVLNGYIVWHSSCQGNREDSRMRQCYFVIFYGFP